MTEFIKGALPFVLIGLSIALFAVSYAKKHHNKEDENNWDYSSMGPILGVAVGIAIGSANEGIGEALGAGAGMFFGTIIELAAENIKK